MALRTTTKWLAASLHYGEPWNELLIKAVKPYTDVVLQTGVAERFYFLRSWENGPNIKLWFKGNPFILAKMLKPNLDEHFQHYFESRPSFINPPVYPRDCPEDYKWYPNNSVQYSSSDPSFDHSGGMVELAIVEKQYEISSNLILNTIKEKASHWTYNEMVSSAIKMHLGFAYAMGMDLEEAFHFFSFLSDQWFESNYKKQPDSRSKTQHSFAKIFALQRKHTIPYHAAIWELVKRYEHMEDKFFVQWIKVNANTCFELNFALDEQKLSAKRSIFNATQDTPRGWGYYASLVRLTNNRIGIFNKNEGYLFYTMCESLKVALQSNRTSLVGAAING